MSGNANGGFTRRDDLTGDAWDEELKAAIDALVKETKRLQPTTSPSALLSALLTVFANTAVHTNMPCERAVGFVQTLAAELPKVWETLKADADAAHAKAKRHAN